MTAPVRIVLGIVLLLIATITVLAMVSYTGVQLGATSTPDRNLMGVVGAGIAWLLLTTFGLAAFIIPLAMGWGGYAMIRDRDPRRASRRATGVFILLPCLAGIVHVAFSGIDGGLLSRWEQAHFGGSGGLVGRLMFGDGSGRDALPVGFVRVWLDVIGGLIVLALDDTDAGLPLAFDLRHFLDGGLAVVF